MAAVPLSTGNLERSVGRNAFGTDAAGYHAGRIGYPDELFEHVFERVPPNPRILEIGAGTGLATQSLLTRDPSELVIVESDAVLAQYLRDRFRNPAPTIIRSDFPDVSLEGTFDLIVCAAAFHWLKPRPALARIRELMKPGGIWAMWWNAYRNPSYGDPLAKAVTPLLKGIALPPSEGRSGHYSLDIDLHVSELRSAGFSDIRHATYRRERTLSADEVRTLYASYSYIRALAEAKRTIFLDKLSDVVKEQFGGWGPNVVMTTVYSAAID